MIMSQSQSPPDLEYIYWLPTELWELIATKYLKNPRDLYNLCDASPYFFGLLQRKRPQFLLQLVLPILGSPTGFLDPYLKRNDMLNFRLANRSCNNSVEYYFQQHLFEKKSFISEVDLPIPSYFYYDQYVVENESLRTIKRRIAARIDSRNYIAVEGWLNDAQATHPPDTTANPTLSREAHFSLITSGERVLVHGILPQVTRQLQLYGRHFNRCTFVFGREIAMELRYDHLKKWLNLAPNLNFLHVDFSKDIHPGTTRDLAEWNGYIASNPMPTLRQLKVLKMTNLSYPLQQSFFQGYGHVETLHLAFNGNEAEKFGPVELVNLKTLKVEIYCPSDLIALKSCLTSSWLQLQTLEMDFASGRNNRNRHGCRDWSQIISFLNDNFSQATRLVQLLLRFGKSNDRDAVLRDTRTCRLKLRHIEQLKLSVEDNQFLIDFILPMKNSLRKLAVLRIHPYDGLELPFNHEVDFEEKIAWNGRLGSLLLESNIWTTFRKLNFLRVENTEGYTYRRLRGTPIYINPNGKEVSVLQFEENVSEEEDD